MLSRKHQRGSAVLVLLAFLGLMTILCAATTATVIRSQKEVHLIEKRQLARWAAVTNEPSPSRSMNAP